MLEHDIDAGGLSRRTFVKGAAVVAALCALSPTLTSCGKSTSDNGGSTAPTTTPKWKNTDMTDTVEAATATDVKSDFHLAINRDWLANVAIPTGRQQVDSFTERADGIQAAIEILLKGGGPGGEGVDAARLLYSACLSEQGRAARGVEPLRPFIERIESIQTLAQLSTFLCFDSQLIVDPLITFEVHPDRRDRTRNAVYLKPGVFSLHDAAEYVDRTAKGSQLKAADDTFFTSVFIQLGYSRNAAQTIVKNAFNLEQSIASFCASDADKAKPTFADKSYNPYSLSALTQATKRFPLGRMMSAVGFANDTLFVLEQPDWLTRLDVLYVSTAIESFKDLLLVNTVARYAACLDRDMLDLAVAWRNTVDDTSNATDFTANAYRICDDFLGDLLSRMYVDAYYTTGTAAGVEELTSQIRDALVRTVSSSKWLSDSARTHAVAKLAALTIRVAFPDEWPSFADLAFATTGSSADIVSWCAVAQRHRWNAAVTSAGFSTASTGWRLSPQNVHVAYEQADNSLTVPAGLLGGIFYAPGGSASANRGGLGALIAREMVHAIDVSGSQYDAAGNPATWWSDEDRDAFEQLQQGVADYYGAITVLTWRNEDGARVAAEAIADITGLQCVEALEEAAEKNHPALLGAFARLWRRQLTDGRADNLLTNSTYPFGFLRTDVSVQQSPYFHTAYAVTEGDDMYLAPDSRFEIW